MRGWSGLQRQEEAFIAEQRRLAAAREQDSAEPRPGRGGAPAPGRARCAERRGGTRGRGAADAGSRGAGAAGAERAGGRAAGEGRRRPRASRGRERACAGRRRAARCRGAGRAGTRRQLAAQAEQEKAQLRDQLRQQLNVILETRETARGLIVNLSDVLFDTARHDLKPGAREKLARVSGILSSHPGPEDRDRGPHRQRRQRRLQPEPVGASSRVGPQLSGAARTSRRPW